MYSAVELNAQDREPDVVDPIQKKNYLVCSIGNVLNPSLRGGVDISNDKSITL